MKQVKFFGTIAIAAIVLFISSCNSGDEKTPTDTPPDSSGAKKETVAPPAAGPVMMMTIMSKVSNYAKWKPLYESHDSFRLAYGLHNYVVVRGIDDSNMVVVVLKMDDVAKAKEMAASKELKDKMKSAGVISAPVIDYTEVVMSDTSAIDQRARLMVRHKVKDWTAWKKVFDGNKDARVAAGLTDRTVSHTVGDDHDVTLIFAVADIVKAKAFANSKELKDKMAEGGVEGPPTLFFYKIAEKY